MPCIDPENTPLPGDLENVLLRKLLNRLCNISSGGGGGGVSQAYVDARDAATLASANAFTNAGLAGKENVANKSTDGTFAANSDTLYPSQKAAKTYVDNAITVTAAGLYVLKAGDTMTGALLLPSGAVATPSLSHAADANTGLWFPAADIIAFSTSGAERIRIDTDGLVSAVSANPISLILSNSSAAGSNRVLRLVTSDAAVTNAGLTLENSSANAASRNWGIATNLTAFGDFYIGQSNAIGGNPFAAGTARLYINPSGNVSIGNTLALARLHVTPSASGTDYFRIDHSDGTPRFQFGVLTGGVTVSTLYLGNVVPSTTNFTLASDGAAITYLNAPAGGSLNFVIGNTIIPWSINASGHFLAGTDNTYDIGASGATRPRNYFGAGTVNTAGGLITGNVASLVTSSAAMNDGAAAGLGTITNAPAAGNPTKWIPINDNGTVRYFPAW